jgi:hypothetical protein
LLAELGLDAAGVAAQARALAEAAGHKGAATGTARETA